MTTAFYPCPAEWDRRAIRVEVDDTRDMDTFHGWMVVRSDDPEDRLLGRLWLDGDDEPTPPWDGTRIYPEDGNEGDQELISRVLDHIQGYTLGSAQGTR